jgi:hypothetical protein
MKQHDGNQLNKASISLLNFVPCSHSFCFGLALDKPMSSTAEGHKIKERCDIDG